MVKRNLAKILSVIVLVIFSIAFAMMVQKTSFGADIEERAILEGAINKYINYELENGSKGTLVQYQLRTGIEYGNDFSPIKNSELSVSFNQIDGKYPYDVRVIVKSTEATNGKTKDIEENYNYDVNTGIVTINASNENENGEIINTEKQDKDVRDEYLIIANYDTYTSEKPEREIGCQVVYKAQLETEDNREIIGTGNINQKMNDNIGELTSVSTEVNDIYNGYIKSNIVNGTNYNTEYTEKNEIVISKRDAQQKIKIYEENTFVSLNDIYYKSTKFQKNDILNLLGEEGKIEIFDGANNIISTIDKNTEFDENGEFVVSYGENTNNIFIKTSDIVNEGILRFENEKYIKGDNRNLDDKDVKTITKVLGINEDKIDVQENDVEIVENTTYETKNEKNIEVKEATTNVEVEIDNEKWTNEKQNDVNFDVLLDSISEANNLFDNPTIRIKMPNEVENVILKDSQIVYANGLEIKDIYTENDENGILNIVINLKGSQKQYNLDEIGLITSIKIKSIVTLKEDIQSKEQNIVTEYINNYNYKTEEGKTNNKVSLINYEHKEDENKNDLNNENGIIDTVTGAVENKVKDEISASQTEIEGLNINVKTSKGDSTLNNGDIIYEGEFLKYTVTLKNTTDNPINNVKIVGTIPEGLRYSELSADYYSFEGKYEYLFDEELREKEIEIGTINAGETITKFYEVQVEDLEGVTEKTVNTNIKAYIGDTESFSYDISNIVNESDIRAFYWTTISGEENGWDFAINLDNPEGKEVTMEINVPEGYEASDYEESEIPPVLGYEGEFGYSSIHQGNYLPEDSYSYEYNGTSFKITTRQTSGVFKIQGMLPPEVIRENYDSGSVMLESYANITVEDTIFKLNEVRFEYSFSNVSVRMSSENEGQEVKYGEEINYNIEVTCLNTQNAEHTGNEARIYVNILDYLPENVEPVSMTYEYYETEKTNDSDGTEFSGELGEKQTATIDISGEKTDKDGNKLAEVDIHTWIPKGETIHIEVKTLAGYVYEETEVENSAIVQGEDVNTKTSNIVKHTILPYGYGDEIEDPDNPGEPEDPDNPGEPEDPDNPGEPEDPDNPENKFDISGVVWDDNNGDGKRQNGEELLSGIQVLLVDLHDSSNVKAQRTTNDNGEYEFKELDKSNYIVVFKYNTDLYMLTEYKKKGVPDDINSDVTNQNIILDGEYIDVGVTDEINLVQDENHIDMGLIGKGGYDLKLDKYIMEVTVTTANGTKQYSYDNTKLGKVEIRAKELNNAKVTTKYKIVITNEGKSNATVKEIYDYLPSGLDFSKENNVNWSNEDGKLVNRSLSGETIKPGESKEITLILTKVMNEKNTGTFTNAAEIGSVDSGILGIEDLDSTPGNKNINEDDYSEAELIISVGTGLVTYISIGIILMFVLIVLAIFIYKKKININKFSKLVIILLAFTVFQFTNYNYFVEAGYKDTQTFVYVEPNPFPGPHTHTFRGGPTGSGWCVSGDLFIAAGYYGYGCSHSNSGYYYWKTTSIKTETNYSDWSPAAVELTKENSTIGVKKIGNSYVLGPFETTSNASTNYNVTVYDKEGEIINNWAACNSEGIGQATIPANRTFYISINATTFETRGVSRVKASQSIERYRTYTEKQYGSILYKYKPRVCRGNLYHQNVVTTGRKILVNTNNTTEEITDTKSITWTNFNATLDIEKVDKDNPNLKLDIEGNLSKNDGTFSQDFKTTNGEYHFDNLTPGAYTLTETVNNNYGYEKNVQTKIPVTVTGGKPNKVTMKNIKYTGNLRIVKKDIDNDDKILEGVEFKLQNSNGYVIGVDDTENNITSVKGTVRFSNMKYTNDINQATTFITDANGQINIYDIKDGIYTVKEISFGDNYGYEIDDNYIFWDNGTSSGTGSEGQIQVDRRESTVTEDTTTTGDESKFTIMTFNNRRKYIKLSGLVWEDMISGKTDERDSKYSQGASDETNPDKLVSNVTVKLKDANGNDVSFKTQDGRTVTEVLTDENGSYTMVDILIDKLNEYYVEFTYNGMSYASVPIVDLLPEKVNTSKAKENDEERTEFNNNYSTITHSGTTDPVGEARDENGNNTYNLHYDETEHYVDDSGVEIDQVKSTLNYGENSVYGYEGQRFPVNMTDEQYLIKATTKDAYQDNGQTGYLSDMYTAEEIRGESIEEIKNVNLGLYEREQPDLAIVEDIDTAKITLNGYEHTYKYNQRFNTNQDSDGFNVGVKFANEYGSQTYTRTIYSSDIVYNMQEGNEGKLEVYITYKIALRNESTNLYTRINEVINYFDERYDVDNIRDESGAELSYTPVENVGNGFKKINITTNQEVEHQKQNIIYITYKLQNDAINAVLNQDITLDSITEISSYSSYSDENYSTHYGGIDKDSRPGSTIPENANNASDDENLNTYEDDTDSAPSLILEVENGRIIRGTVWEDNAIEELLLNTGYDKERKGDGLYVNGENVVEKVKIELLTCTDDGKPGEIATLYHEDEVVEPAEVYTKYDGSYEFEGIVPGKYLIRYTYGNESLIVSSDGNKVPIETVEKYKSTIYRTGDKSAAEAMTDYWYRAETGEGNTRMSDAKDEIGISSDGTRYDIVAERIEETEKNVYTYGSITGKENPSNLQNIEADTRMFDIKLDYDINLDNISEYGADLKFIFDNIDFGIVRRPIQNLEVRKEISYVQVKLANGQVIIEGDPREGSINYLRYLPDGNIHIELDQELIQGATITIRYDVIVNNTNCEIDYNDEDYYIYGIVPAGNNNWKIATITDLYDYLSNGLILDKDNINNENWTQIEVKQDLVTSGLLSEEAFEAVKQFNQVLQTDAFKNMTPGQEVRVPLEASRILSNSADDFMFTNDIEVNEVTGRKMEHDGDYTIPGNYEPSNGETGYDDDYVYLTITGPTGENRNYIQYIILGTIGLITLGAGIILIKKKVL